MVFSDIWSDSFQFLRVRKNIDYEWEIAIDTEEGQGKMLLKKNGKYLKTVSVWKDEYCGNILKFSG